ncbi:hypothetical protein QNI23_012485 [Bermanella sp. WJH001]|uniref:hypothetical protein n=1 Tax=Bermanella sp. WJH001 TaxID=3048005 RepID=UPI0024BE6130|nr:hypothetical protein [Bermanella sp. WJH001]MDJ1537806.1 hypothetical protein [Bermanella sp. WJH001]
MKKIPRHAQEYRVWPPLTAAYGIFIGLTLFDVLSAFHQALLSQPDSHYLMGYLFPVLMGLGLALPLHGKYWLGFAWLGVICYGFSYVFHFFFLDNFSTPSFIVITCLAILFTVQAFVLLLKRIFFYNVI